MTNDVLEWEPLTNTGSRIINPDFSKDTILKIGAFGTCGNPSNPDYISWRNECLVPIAEMYGVGDRIFNPEAGEWTPDRAPIEGFHFARDSVLAVAVTNHTGSPAAIMEAGFAAYGGILRGQKVTVSIEENEHTPDNMQIPRQLALSVLRATEKQYPLFMLTDKVEVLANRSALELRTLLNNRESNVGVHTQYELPAAQQNLLPEIYLSGTSGERKPAWMARIKDTIHMLDPDVPIVTAIKMIGVQQPLRKRLLAS